MLRTERLNDFQEALRSALDGRQAAIWSALPGIIISFNASAMTAVVQPALSARIRAPDGTTSPVRLPVLVDCPVFFPGGGGALLTFPIAAGDECLVVFASRCIDAWWQQGGVQPQAEFRMHDLSDGFVFAGVRSQPRALTVGPGAQLRSESGSTVVELDGAGEILTLTSPNPIVINAPSLQVNGDILTTGSMLADGAVAAGVGGADHVTMQAHVHSIGGPVPIPGF